MPQRPSTRRWTLPASCSPSWTANARGGAALSIKAVTGKPIKFVGVGEKLDQVELFYPDRMASRILGMGDVLSLIEKAQQTFDAKKAAELEQKLRKKQVYPG